jgi:uncharacterized membrane protein
MSDSVNLTPKSPPLEAPPTRRLMSLDALRGFDMLWMVRFLYQRKLFLRLSFN